MWDTGCSGQNVNLSYQLLWGWRVAELVTPIGTGTTAWTHVLQLKGVGLSYGFLMRLDTVVGPITTIDPINFGTLPFPYGYAVLPDE